MPPAVAIPLALAGVSMVSQNVQNKSAIKNNEVQQASAVGNTQQAYQNAQNNLNAYETAHPAPFTGANPGRPVSGSFGPGGLMAPTSYNAATGPAPSASPMQAPNLASIIQQIMAQRPAQPSAPVPAPAAPAPQPLVQRFRPGYHPPMAQRILE